MALLGIVGLCGCDEPSATEIVPPPGSSSTSSEVEAVAPRARDEIPPRASVGSGAVPAALAGEDVAACTARLSSGTPPEVRATLVDLGWTDFYGDACGAAIAVRDGSVSACDALSARALRERCRLRVAVAHADVSACPPARGGVGRDALCVALASGIVGLCRGTSVVDQPSCRALLERDPERCAASPSAEARCRAEVAELAALVPAPDPSAPRSDADIPEPALVLEVRRVVPGADGEVVSEPETIAIGSFERGAVMVTADGATRITIGEAASRGGEPAALVELELPAEVEGDGTLEATLRIGTEVRLDLHLPDVGTLSGGEGEIVITTLEPRLGGRLAGRIRAELIASVGSVRVTGRFATFVRDRAP